MHASAQPFKVWISVKTFFSFAAATAPTAGPPSPLDPGRPPTSARGGASALEGACPPAGARVSVAVVSPPLSESSVARGGGLFGGGSGGGAGIVDEGHARLGRAGKGARGADARALELRVRPNHGFTLGAGASSALAATSATSASWVLTPLQKLSTARNNS